MGERRQVVTATIPASPEAVFAVVSDPARHTEIDGSGMLRGVPAGDAPPTKVGDAFLMEMTQEGLGEYQMRNEIVAYEAGKTFAWKPLPNRVSQEIIDLLGDMDPTGYTFAFELAPTADGQTAVTHIYDWNGVKDDRVLPLFPRISAEQMSETISRVAKLVGG